jgi:tripartite-type tricarboxylate transporter receptor subunit TctC
MFERASRFAALVLAGLLGFGSGARLTSASAQDVASFYRSHALTLGVPNDSGGTYDIYVRLLARHIASHIPGNPTIIVQNVPAAGGLALADNMYSSVPKDGSYIGLIRGTVIQEQNFDDPQVKFDARKFEWLGNINADRDTCIVWSASGVNNISDLYKREVVLGASGAGAQSYSFPRVFAKLLGMKLKVIAGYPGTPDRIVAMERGELTGGCGVSVSSLGSGLSDWLKNGKIRVLLQVGLEDDPRLKGIPNILNEAKTEEARRGLEFLILPLAVGRAMAAPPGVAADRLTALRKAFSDTMSDPALVADARNIGVDIDWSDSVKTTQLVDDLLSTPKSIVQIVQTTQ